jgi:hypothetical protein
VLSAAPELTDGADARCERDGVMFSREEVPTMVKPVNKIDKQRFKKLKTAQTKRGRDEKKATEVSAQEVRELRRREGRAKGSVDENDGW